LSSNGGKNWEKFQLNLPIVPITDLTIRNNDLIASTQGRAFWILDDLTFIHQFNEKDIKKDFHLYTPRTTVRISGGSKNSPLIGQNPQTGTVVIYHIADEIEKDSEVKLEILDDNDSIIRTITNKKGSSAKTFGENYQSPKIPTKKGVNRFVWNFRVDDITLVPDVSFYGGYAGYRIGPGQYYVRLTMGEASMTQPFKVEPDPKIDIRDHDFNSHQTLMADLYGQINDLHSSIVKARSIRNQIQKMNGRLKEKNKVEDLIKAGETAIDAIDMWEGNVVQTKMETFQDVVNFLNRLNSHMLSLLSTIDGSDPPLTQGQRERFVDLSEDWRTYKEKLNQIMDNEVGEFNRLYKEEGFPVIIIPE
jgi:hypothetical protein